MSWLSKLLQTSHPVVRVLIYWFLSLLAGLAFTGMLLTPFLVSGQTRFAMWAGLCAIFLGFIAATFLAWLWYGDDAGSVTLGFKNHRWLKGVSGGLLSAGAVVLLVLLIYAAGLIQFGSFSPPTTAFYSVYTASVIFLTAAIEGLLLRGFPIQSMTRKPYPESWLVVLSVVYVLLHSGNPGYFWLSYINIFLMGLWLSYATLAAGTLWYSVGLHTGWNLSQTLIFGYSGVWSDEALWSLFPVTVMGNSSWLAGNDSGIEGSVMTTILIILLISYERTRWLRSLSS
ncbi:MAG: CPBP family intramembrane metalloprotease [Bacteroidetes bacterium]|nr:CPBP family intramembrane metalloprotease [Bacteroidota bacterium]